MPGSRAAKNKIIDWYRKKRLRTVSLQDRKGAGLTLEELIEDSGINVEKDFIREQVTEALIDSVTELPDAQRDVVIAQAIEGATFREISEKTGLPTNTLIARKRYALQFLRRRLSEMKEVIQEIA